MALTGSSIASTYLKLLRANSDTMGADATASYIQDSADTDSALSISTTRVGIGTAAPAVPLDVTGRIRTSQALVLYDSSTAGGLYTHKIVTGGGANLSPSLFAETGLGLHFMTGGSTTEKMIIDSSGSVGIGCSPDFQLHLTNSIMVNSEISSTTFGAPTDHNSTEILRGCVVLQRDDTSTVKQISFHKNGSEHSYLETSTTGLKIGGADVTITGDLIMADGKGIDFSADASPAAGMTAEILDDYEEGTWTMGLLFGGNGVGLTYSANTGFYTKIGNVVTISGECVLTSKGSSTGGVRFSGFPFTVNNSSSAKSAVSLKLVNVSFADSPSAFTDPNRADAQGLEVTNAGAMTALTDADFSDNSEYVIHATYRAA